MSWKLMTRIPAVEYERWEAEIDGRQCTIWTAWPEGTDMPRWRWEARRGEERRTGSAKTFAQAQTRAEVVARGEDPELKVVPWYGEHRTLFYLTQAWTVEDWEVLDTFDSREEAEAAKAASSS